MLHFSLSRNFKKSTLIVMNIHKKAFHSQPSTFYAKSQPGANFSCPRPRPLKVEMPNGKSDRA